jgi:hypothetical protein
LGLNDLEGWGLSWDGGGFGETKEDGERMMEKEGEGLKEDRNESNLPEIFQSLKTSKHPTQPQSHSKSHPTSSLERVHKKRSYNIVKTNNILKR